MGKSISILLGAGFSAPMGYPVGNQLNELLLNCDDCTISFDESGSLVKSIDGSKPDLGYKTNYDYEFDFCRDLIQYFYKDKGYFDYEEFYDFFKFDAEIDAAVGNFFKKGDYGYKTDLSQMLYRITNIYNQLVGNFLVDRQGNSWYDTTPILGPNFPGYTGILDCIKTWAEEYIINIHSLNHDLFFESLNNSDWIKGRMCDGFEELGSPYYGELTKEGQRYKCRLQYYTGKYQKSIRLHKLHGSKDYCPYYDFNGLTSMQPVCIKNRKGIPFSELYMEVLGDTGQLEYRPCSINHHSDFLTGTTSKIERYEELYLFKKLFQHFQINLNEAEKLIIIGYGGKDRKINEIITDNFDHKNKHSYIVDPCAGEAVINLKQKIKAKLIPTDMEVISVNEFRQYDRENR